MKAAKLIVVLLTVFVSAPIWYYLLYKILVSVNASELMMFLYWIYTPAGLLIAIIRHVIDSEKS